MMFAQLLDTLFNLKAALISATIFIPVEVLVPRRRSQPMRSRGWTVDLAFLTINFGMTSLAVFIGTAAVAAVWTFLSPDPLSVGVSRQPTWLQVIELIILIDLAHYSAHRLFHAVPFLWRFHAVHHSSQDLDWLATSRVHPVDQTFTGVGMMAPVVMLGFSPSAIAIWAGIYRLHAVLQHANVSLPLGRLGLLIVGPEFHRWHHSDADEGRDKNFAAQFAVWDWIFGTGHLPVGRVSEAYGITDFVPEGYIDQLCYPFRMAGLEVAAPRPRRTSGDAAH
jgi:sterol desaturase/sphingolipid hydroxylase (fatty acid hydroxylase superfamily)